MVSKAKQNLEKSYCNYSKFHVGASLLTTKGQFDGVNVENASYGYKKRTLSALVNFIII